MGARRHRQSRLNPFQLLKRNWMWIFLWGSLTFLAIAPWVYFLTKPSYSAVVELRIDPTANSSIPGMDTSAISQFYSEYVATQKFKILKRANIQKALEQIDVASQVSITGGRPITDQLLEAIAKGIAVDPNRETLILTVEYSSGRPDGIAEFLNALVGVYIDDLRTERSNLENNRLQLSDQQLQDNRAKIDALNKELRQISEETGSVSFTAEDIPFKIELRSQEQAAINAENDRVLKEKRYNQFLSTLDKVKSLGADSVVEDRLRSDSTLTEQKRSLFARIDTLNAQAVALAPENPKRRDIEDNIAKIQQQIVDLDTNARQKYQKSVASEKLSTLERQRIELQNDYIIAKGFEDSIKASYSAVKEKYSFYANRILRAQNIVDELATLKAQSARVNSSLADIRSQQSSQGNVNIENLAKRPTLPGQSNRMKNLIFVLVGSFSWVVVLFLILEFLDQRIKSVAELKSFTGIQPSWPISHYSGNFLRASIDEPTSVSNKAIASLATRINQRMRNNQARVISFTGVNILSGTTEILLNCAHNMKTNCEKILVIDFNTRRPGIAYKLGIPSSLRPSVEAIEKGPWERAIFVDQAREIEILAVQRTRTLDNRALDRVIEQAKERYDVVFVDSGPIIGSPQAEHIFMLSDMVIFVVSGNVTLYPELHQSLDLAINVGVKSVELVLNWWKIKKSESEDKEPAADLIPELES